MIHPPGSCQKAKLYRARMLTGHEFFRACMRLVFQNITEMSVKNSTFIGGFSLIKISDGLLHLPGTRQCLKLYPARAITGTRFFRSLYASRVQKDH